MNSIPALRTNKNGELNKSNSGDVSESPVNVHVEAEAKQRELVVEWLHIILPNLNLSIKASDEELRTCLIDGIVLCQILKRIRPTCSNEVADFDPFSLSRVENVKRFLASLDKMGIPRFEMSDLDKGSMKPVIDCLARLRAEVIGHNFATKKTLTKHGSIRGDVSPHSTTSPRSTTSPLFGEERRKVLSESQLQQAFRTPVMSEQSAALIHHGGHKFHEIFQMKQGRYSDLPATKIAEMMKSNTLDNAPTQSLLSVVNGILDESVEKKTGEIPHRVACLLKKVVQEIERRISTQAEHLRTQNNLFKAREEKYQSRIRVLEALASGTGQETEIVMNQLQQIKTQKSKIEEKKKHEDEDVVKLMKEKEKYDNEISALKQELDMAKKIDAKEKDQCSLEISALKQELEMDKKKHMIEMDQCNLEISALKQDLEMAKKTYELRCLQMETQATSSKTGLEGRLRVLEHLLAEATGSKTGLEGRLKELEHLLAEATGSKTGLEDRLKELECRLAEASGSNTGTEDRSKELECLLAEATSSKTGLENRSKELECLLAEATGSKTGLENRLKELERILAEATGSKTGLADRLKELEGLLAEATGSKRGLEDKLKELEGLLAEATGSKRGLEDKLKELECLLTDSRNKVKKLEATAESKSQVWSKKENIIQSFMDLELGGLRELRFSSDSIKQEILKAQKSYSDEFHCIGVKLKALQEAAENYHAVLAENRKLFNEVQDLKGNIRVYCRVRPFLPGQAKKQTSIEYIGDNGELIVTNPSKPGKDGQRMFKFNKIYGPAATQAEVFKDTQPLIRSVLDGFNVCIFAYGQTGSGKTYTMTGPENASEEDWGVNYRALNDLFTISRNRKSSILYEVGVQMVEIYNEQVRDLLISGSQKKLGILSTSQPNGLAVPDATMLPVTATSDVLDLINIGLKNRAMGATAMNERSSRSHSVVTVHVRGKDLKTGVPSFGNLHLVDLAGSERVDRSEVTGDRLREAQHINKSLSALGDVIFALAAKSPHIPYRNSKLTQVLQSSLGGQAKTLMFVQLNPDAISFSESLSTLKFAERVSGVELGAAKSSKEGRDVKELMEQVASLKDTINKRDEEIERLQLLKDLKPPGANGEKRGANSSRH